MYLEDLENQTRPCVLSNASAKEIREPYEDMKKKKRG